MFNREHYVLLGTSLVVAFNAKEFGNRLESARKSAGLTQAALAQRSSLHRLQIVRMEAGVAVPRLDETLRLAESLKVPLEYLTDGRFTPTHDLRGIAVELYRLGIRDLVVANPRVPGVLRHPEETLVLVVSGDRPKPRLLEAIPFVLARRKFRASLVSTFAKIHDKRAITRLGWLSEITLALSNLATMPIAMYSEPSLNRIIHVGRTAKKAGMTAPDSLGHPGVGNLGPIWKRWNITYGGTIQDFLHRTIEVDDAFRRSQPAQETLRGEIAEF